MSLALDLKIETQFADRRAADLESRLIEARARLRRTVAYQVQQIARNGNVDSTVSLREHVYRATTPGDLDFDVLDPLAPMVDVITEASRMSCGGMASSYVWMLGRIGIPARTVQLASRAFLDGRVLTDTHVTVEVYDKTTHRSHVSDPTFNVSFQCESTGEKLDIQGMRQCVNGGGRLTPVRDGQIYLPGRTLESYELPYAELLHAVSAEPLHVNGVEVLEAVDLPYSGWPLLAQRQFRR